MGGITPLSWQEIRAWRTENDLSLSLYEVNAIRRLSAEYASEYHAASEKGRQPPYQEFAEEDFDRTAVSNKILNFLRGVGKDEQQYEEAE